MPLRQPLRMLCGRMPVRWRTLGWRRPAQLLWLPWWRRLILCRLLLRFLLRFLERSRPSPALPQLPAVPSELQQPYAAVCRVSPEATRGPRLTSSLGHPGVRQPRRHPLRRPRPCPLPRALRRRLLTPPRLRHPVLWHPLLGHPPALRRLLQQAKELRCAEGSRASTAATRGRPRASWHPPSRHPLCRKASPVRPTRRPR